MKELLQAVLKHADETLGNGTGTTEEVVLGKAVEHVAGEIMKAGSDKGKLKSVLKDNAARITALAEAVEKGGKADDKITLPVWKASAQQPNTSQDGKALDDAMAKALEALSKMANGESAGGGQDTDKAVAECPECGWKGPGNMLKAGKCPECGAKIMDAPATKGFEVAKAKFLGEVAKAAELDDAGRKRLADRLAELRDTDKGKEDAALKKAAVDLEAIAKGLDPVDPDWPRDLNEALDEDDEGSDGE